MMSGTKSNPSYNQGKYSDLFQLYDGRIVLDDGGSFDVHKVILAASSEYFRSLFCGMNCEMAEHRISNITKTCMREVLNYIYTNNVCATEMNINDLLVASDYFLLEDLKLKLTKYVKATLTEDICLKLCLTAYQINQNEILQNCFTYVERRFQKILENKKKDFIDLPQEVLKNILRSRNLNTESERNVWQAIVYWIQADIESRLKDLPSLLTTLAVNEIVNDLATEIINHDIVLSNLHMEPLLDTCTKSFNYIPSDDRLLKRLLHMCSNDLPLQNFRIPQKLNIMRNCIPEENICEICISYDETPDFWRKIMVLDFYPDFLAVIGWNIFFRSLFGERVLSFNMRTQEQKTIEQLQTMITPSRDSTVAIGNYIFIFYRHNNTTCAHVYDATINIGFCYELLNKPLHVQAVAIRENIFVVGVEEGNMTEMFALVFNSVTRRHTVLAKPDVLRRDFSIVAYHEKIYLIGGRNRYHQGIRYVEVFNPAENLWKILPAIPISTNVSMFVNVFNDQLFVHDVLSEEGNPVAVRWNELEECWEKLDKSKIIENFSYYKLNSIDNTEQIKFLTKQNRKSQIQLKKIPSQLFVKPQIM